MAKKGSKTMTKRQKEHPKTADDTRAVRDFELLKERMFDLELFCAPITVRNPNEKKVRKEQARIVKVLTYKQLLRLAKGFSNWSLIDLEFYSHVNRIIVAELCKRLREVIKPF